MTWPPRAERTPPSTLHYVHVRTELARRDAATDEVLADLNEIIGQRGGIVLANRQIVWRPLEPEGVVDRYFDDENTSDWVPPKRRWNSSQATYFGALLGVRDPFQFSEARKEYGRYCIGLRVPGSYLGPSERILGLVDAGRDNRNYYCPCHFAEVVYTSARRAVCMMCGYMHCVLSSPLPLAGRQSWSEDEWHRAFDADGVLLDHRMRVPYVEYQDVYAARKLWATDAWDESSSDIEFFARGDPEEIARWRRGQPTAEDFLEAGWSEVPQPPTPARQMDEEGFGVDIAENAALATNAAAADFFKSQTHPAQLRAGVLNAFQAIELLLKIKLEAVDPSASRRLTNPQIVAALQAAGVSIDAADLALIGDLRSLRNKLQHSEARYGFRDTRALLERAFIFIDRFTSDELQWWVGEVVEPPAWDALLRLAPIAKNAVQWSERMVAEWLAHDGLNSVEPCPTCGRDSVLRKRSRAGLCAYCRRMPIIPPGR